MRLAAGCLVVAALVGFVAVPARAATVQVQVIDSEFAPDPTINIGDTIRWVWDSDMPHNVRSAPWEAAGGITFDSGYFSGTGPTFEYTFTQAGVVDYYCDLHGFVSGNTILGMAGRITVVPEPAGLLLLGAPLLLAARRRAGT